ncbi:MAG: ParB/RepB/Spo0J family partition protein [Methylobacter sp.]|jgi:ParB family chromosome partitioning protein|nr:ParB/RepB/Spo0J family partition protein [Methylobacter sp.]
MPRTKKVAPDVQKAMETTSEPVSVPESKNEGRIVMVALEDLQPNPYQPKTRRIVPDSVAERFGASIHEHGLLQTPIARMVDGHYEMGDGWLRRSGYVWLNSHDFKGFEKMPVAIRTLSDRQMADMVIEANSVRKDLNPIEQAQVYVQYIQDFQITQSELGRIHNLSQAEISNTIRLLELPDDIQTMIISGEISQSHGRYLLQLKGEDNGVENMRILARSVVAAGGMHMEELDSQIKAIIARSRPSLDLAEEVIEPAPVETEEAAGETEEAIEETEEPAAEIASLEDKPKTVSSSSPVKSSAPAAKPSTPQPAPVAKPSAPQPTQAVKPQPKPEPPKPLPWGRKLIIEERNGKVHVSVMKEGGFPIFKPFEGTIEGLLGDISTDGSNSDSPIMQFLKESTAKWQAEMQPAVAAAPAEEPAEDGTEDETEDETEGEE